NVPPQGAILGAWTFFPYQQIAPGKSSGTPSAVAKCICSQTRPTTHPRLPCEHCWRTGRSCSRTRRGAKHDSPALVQRMPDGVGDPRRDLSLAADRVAAACKGRVRMTIRIRNWSKHQHFKDRTPPWIKLYRDILDDPDWHAMSGDDAKLLVGLWLVASEDESRTGTLPACRRLAFRLRISEAQLNQ